MLVVSFGRLTATALSYLIFKESSGIHQQRRIKGGGQRTLCPRSREAGNGSCTTLIHVKVCDSLLLKANCKHKSMRTIDDVNVGGNAYGEIWKVSDDLVC
jgi:hypothetical protein